MSLGRFQPGVGWFFLGLLLGAGLAHAGPVELIRIESADPEALVRLESTRAAPVFVLADYALAWGDREAIGEIAALGFSAESLGPRVGDRWYSIVFLGERFVAKDAPPPEEFGRVLFRSSETAILEHRLATIDHLAAAYEIISIPDSPMIFSRPRAKPIAQSIDEFDPLVGALVDAVDAERLREYAQALQDFGPRVSGSSACNDATDYLMGLFTSYGLTATRFDYEPASWCDNVIGFKQGRDPEAEIYVIGGHYDSVTNSPGADDNASGTAAVVEAARLLSAHEFEAEIWFVAFGGEEQGLVGSRALAQWAAGMEYDIRGMINLDMIGYLPGGVAGDLDVLSDNQSFDLRNLAFEAAAMYLPEYPLVDGFLSGGGSDHMSFWGVGYPAIFFHEDSVYRNPFYHSAADVIDVGLNDFDFMRRNVQAAVGLLAALARPLRVRIAHTPLSDPASDVDWYPIEAEVVSNAPLRQDSILVRYAVDDGPVQVLPMEAIGDSSLYRAWIPRQGAGRRIEYEIYARDIEGRTAHDPPRAPLEMHQIVVGLAEVYSDGFEQESGWVVGAPEDDATAGVWVRVDPVGTDAQPEEDFDPDPGLHCFVTGNGEPGGAIGAEDIDGGTTTLTSPRIDLREAIDFEIEYAWWYVDETHVDDTLQVLLSNDDGLTWVVVEEIGSSDRAWHRTRITDGRDFLAPTEAMRLRFVAEDVGRASLVEAAIDQVRLCAVAPGPTIPPNDERSRLLSAWPLPFKKDVTIRYDLLSEQSVRFLVYDIRGRWIAEIDEGIQGIGPHEFVWSARDAGGEPLSSGIYFLRIEIDGIPRNTLRIPKLQ